jgi:hypothetical protein
VKRCVPGLAISEEVVGNVKSYLNMNFERCIYSICRENEEKLIFFIRNRSFWPQNV